MRIISGKHKGRNIVAPRKLPIRPTADRAKEALFNILNNSYYFPDISVLDLFAGSGNISYEFASRGTQKITAVDVNQGCIKFILETSKHLNVHIDAVKANVFSYLEKTPEKVDVIFADPPYDMPLNDFAKIPEIVFDNNLLLEGGILIIEHAKQTDLSHLDHFFERRKYGSNAFSFFDDEDSHRS